MGGLAVRAFGGSRPLVDIDLYVPDTGLEAIATRASSRLVRAPRRHVDEHWDLTFLELGFGGWSIEIAGADTARVRDGRVEDWRPAGIRFEASEMIEVEGVLLPIMPVAQLVDYKAGLGREVDRLDLGELAPIVTDGTETQEATRHGP